MADSASRPSQKLFPGMRYRDADAAVDWLKRAFGIEEQFVVRDDSGSVVYAQLAFGADVFMVGPERDDGTPLGAPGSPGAVTVGLYGVVEDGGALETLHERALGAGAEEVRSISSTEYGSREFAVRDPEGHLWSFGTYDPTASHGSAESGQAGES